MMVVLRAAFAWDCEDCGRENFSRAVVPEMSAEDRAFLRAEHGVLADEAGDFVTYPDRVQCDHCGAIFATTHFKDA